MASNPGDQNEQERVHKELIDTKIDTLLGVSSRTQVLEGEDEFGNRVTEQNFGLMPPPDDSVLRRLGHDSVFMTRRTTVARDGMPVYPWTTTVVTNAPGVTRGYCSPCNG